MPKEQRKEYGNDNKIENRKENNKGAGLISVIIAVAFVTILGSIIISATLSNYRMKQTNLQTKDSFYDAERALDEVRMGLQGVVSQALSSSYLQVMENYATYDLETKQDLMESVFFETIWSSLAENPATHTTYNLATLSSYLVETKWNGPNLADGYGAILSTDPNSNLMMSYDQEGVVLKNLKVYYRDEKGFVSMITTDIKLVIPDLQFSSGFAMTNIAEYCTIADTALVTSSNGVHVLEGSIYAGKMILPGDSSLAETSGRLAVELRNAETVVSKKEIQVAYADITANNSAIWTTDLIGDSSRIELGGTVNVKNDLTMNGTGTTVVLKGRYNGYGNNQIQADESSSIIINGQDATLNLQSLDVLTLAGHAFIGTKNRSVDVATGLATDTGKDIFTGESITIKSNQLMYLVPAECIGVAYSTVGGSKIVGKSVYGRNPLTASAPAGSISPYEELKNNPGSYDMISDAVIPQKLGHPLSNYLNYKAGVPQVEKVFVQTNGETLVYFYMSFKDENTANQYFKDYYALNAEQITKYADFYTNGITMKDDPKDMLRLQLAGNAMKYEEATTQTSVQNNTLTNGSTKLSASNLTASGSFDALCTKLAFQYSELSNLEKIDLTENIVFDNIVDIQNLKNFMMTNGSGSPKTYQFGMGTSKALITDNASAGAYHYTGVTDSNVHLILATGDVVVDADFTGLIVTDDTLTLSPGADLKADEQLVREALEASDTLDGVTWNVVGFLRDGSNLLNLIGSNSGQESETAVSQLVLYENWSKN